MLLLHKKIEIFLARITDKLKTVSDVFKIAFFNTKYIKIDLLPFPVVKITYYSLEYIPHPSLPSLHLNEDKELW